MQNENCTYREKWSLEKKFWLKKSTSRAFFSFFTKMASSSILPIVKVAIPAKYWADKYIKNEPWYIKKDRMYYEGMVESSYYNAKTKCNNYKINLLATSAIVWLTDDEVTKYDFNAMPLNGELVTETNDTESEKESDADETLNKKKPKTKRRRKLQRALVIR